MLVFILILSLVQALIYWGFDKIYHYKAENKGFSGFILAIVIGCDIFWFPRYFMPVSDTKDGYLCGMAYFAATMAFWMIAILAALITYFSYKHLMRNRYQNHKKIQI